MRIWSFHPSYLDAKGLVALWRETLLAKYVLEGKTQGYTNHPQLLRFKAHPAPLTAINFYLKHVFQESKLRGYTFDETKFESSAVPHQIPVNEGQIRYEKQHLLSKLESRSPAWREKIDFSHQFTTHPLFITQAGAIEEWEKM